MNRESKNVLELKNIKKGFKGKKVLKDISLDFKKGEIAAILGKSGVGKTTLLRCITGLEKCDSGSIKIGEEYLCIEKEGNSVYPAMGEQREIRKNIGLVFQNFNLFPHMNVLDNIMDSPVNVLKLPYNEVKKEALEILKLLNLEDKISSYPFELSGGQKQRVAIARACILKPKILCFDEPTSALDPLLSQSIADVLTKLAETGITILIITHDMDFAKKAAQRIVLIDDGKVEYDGYAEKYFDINKN